MKRSKIRRQSPISPSPSPRELTPEPPAVWSGCETDSTMSSSSRPASMACASASPTYPRFPTLSEILSNSAPPPWTLSAFMQYLSQSRCLETLEFTMAAERYRTAYVQLLNEESGWVYGGDRLCSIWEKLINAYIVPCAPRELNLPGPVRDRLLATLSPPVPPDPSYLDESVNIVYDLMNESVLMPFIESVFQQQPEQPAGPAPADDDDDLPELRPGRSRKRAKKDAFTKPDETSRSPRGSFLPQLHIGRTSASADRSPSAQLDPAGDGLTDDSGESYSPSAAEPMTPPGTPPTSDGPFGQSPSTLRRATSAHSGWKKVGAKLGFVKRGRMSRRNTSGGSSDTVMDGDIIMSDDSAGNL